jgi:hypothetical protein
VINNCRNSIIRGDREELELELIAVADVHRNNFVPEASLFEKNRDLVAVGRGPVIKINH